MTEQFEIVALTDVDVAYVQPTPNEGEVIVRKSITAYKRLDNGKVQPWLHRHVPSCSVFLCRPTPWCASRWPRVSRASCG
mgnify:CR=1 FL=1